jgi:hypothetical protein
VTAGRPELAPEQAELVAAFRDALRADRGRVLTLDVARRRHVVLTGAQRAVASAGEPLGAALFAALAEDAAASAADLEAEAAEAAAERERREAEVLARVAVEHDGVAVELDGGPSDIGIAEWVASVEAWAGGGR